MSLSLLHSKLGRDGLRVLLHLAQKCRRDGQVVTASQFLNLTRVTEGGAHDNGLVAVLLVVVVDLGDRQDTRVFVAGVGLASVLLVPVQDTTNERRDQSHAGFSTGNCLREAKEQGQVAVNVVFLLQNLANRSFLSTLHLSAFAIPQTYGSSLDTLPGRSNLDQDAVLADAIFFVKLDETDSLGNSGFLVKRQASINLSRDTTRNNLENFLAKVNQQLVSRPFELLSRVAE